MTVIKIAIADDYPMIIDGLRAMLAERNGLTIVGTAPNGEEMLRVAGAHAPDVVLMDIEMPQKDGVETTREMSIRYPETKVLAMTAYLDRYRIKEMREAGARGCVLKNCSREELEEAIHSLHRGKHYFSEKLTESLIQNASSPLLEKKQTDNRVQFLTKREKEVLKLIAKCCSSKQIAEQLYISPRTADKHRTNMMEKLGVQRIAELIRFAIENKLD